jgi:hypothetical protein
LKDKTIRDKIENFRQYMIQEGAQYQKPTPLQLAEPPIIPPDIRPEPDWIKKVMQHLEFAELFASQTGADLPKAQMLAIDAAAKETGMDLHAYKYILPGIEPQETGYLTPTQIAERITKPGGREFRAHEINNFLAHFGHQVKDEKGIWHLTEKGRIFGKEIPVMRGSWSGKQIIWREEIIAAEKMG